MKSIQYALLICSLGALNALDQKTAEGFQKGLAGEIELIVAPTGDAIGVVAFDPARVSFAALDQLLTELKNSIVAVQSVNLRSHVRTLDTAIKLVKELYQKAWSADQGERYEAVTAEWQELRTLLQNARRDEDDAGARAIQLLITAFDQLELLRQRLESYYEQYAERIAERQKKIVEKKQKAAQPNQSELGAPRKPHPEPAQPIRQPAPQKPNIFQQGKQWLGEKIFNDKEAEAWYQYSLGEIPLVAEAVFVTKKLPVPLKHFDVWNDRMRIINLFVRQKASDLPIGYLSFIDYTDETLKKMYVRRRESFTAQEAAVLMKLIEEIAVVRKNLAERISAVRNDPLSSRYNRYGAELIDLVLAMHQYGAEALRQEILDQIKKQQSPKEETSWKTKLKNFFSW